VTTKVKIKSSTQTDKKSAQANTWTGITFGTEATTTGKQTMANKYQVKTNEAAGFNDQSLNVLQAT
jgi:hypothetical protein